MGHHKPDDVVMLVPVRDEQGVVIRAVNPDVK